MAHYIPTSSDVNSKELAKLYFNNVFRLHGLPDSVVSDRGVSTFSRSLCDLAGIQQKMSTSFHPQTDGQTERVNAIAEQYLRGYCNYQQDNWCELLTMAEFSYNNIVSSSTGITPFFAMYGDHPRYKNPVYRIEGPLTDTRSPTPTELKEFAERLSSLNAYLRSEMSWAQAVYSDQADNHRIPAPKLNVGGYSADTLRQRALLPNWISSA